MALGLEVALVLRARSGPNFLTQTQGLNIKDSIDATAEALRILAKYSESQGLSDTDGQGDNAPGYASGQLLVCSGRLLVVYRLVSSVWVMTVTPAMTNVLLCSQLIAATGRLLVTACKGVDVTPDKIARKYPEIYIATGQLLLLGGLSLDAGSILASAEAEVFSISPENKLKPKGTTAAVKSRLGLGNRKPLPSAPSSSSLQGPSPDPSVTTRVRADDAELMGAPFLLPPEALSPQATAEVPAITPAATAAATPATAGDGLDDLFGPAVPVPGSEFLAGTGLETLEAPAKDYSSFANLRPPPPPPVPVQNPWADFDTGLQPQSNQLQLTKAAAPPAKPTYPPPTSKQQRSIVNGNALQLVECWKASFVGANLDMAGTFGEVLSSGTVPRCAAEVALRITAPDPDSENDLVSAVVRASKGEPGVAETLGNGSAIAWLSEAASPEEAFVKYNLPALAVQPPVLLAVKIAAKPNRLKLKPKKPPAVTLPKPAEVVIPHGITSPFQQAAQIAQGTEAEEEDEEDDEDQAAAVTNGEPLEAEGQIEAAEEMLAVEEDQVAVADGEPGVLRDEEEPLGEDKAAQSEEQTASGAELNGHIPVEASGSAEELQEQAATKGSAEPAQKEAKKETMVLIHLAVTPDLQGAIRGVCVDMDLHTGLGQILGVSPSAQLSLKQRRVRWHLYSLAPGSNVRLRIVCSPIVEGPAFDAACQSCVASLHAFGPPGQGLSGIFLLSGSSTEELRESRQAFHCEVKARPEVEKRRGELTKQDMLAMALKIYQKQLKDAEMTEEAES